MSTPARNIELIREAKTTTDCERQCELARHISVLVRRALSENPKLCNEAKAILKETKKLQQQTNNAALEVLKEPN